MRLFALYMLFVTQSVAYAANPCAPTLQEAVHAFEAGAMTESLTGYRVIRIRADAALGVVWADLKRCDHPEWPATSILATHAAATQPGERPTPAKSAIAIRPGETVRAWRQDTHARLEMAAVSDEAGAVGDRIRLHVATANGQPVHYCFGLVRGPANVEME